MIEEDIKILDDFKRLSAKSQKVFLKTLRLVRKKGILPKIRLLCMRLSLKASIKIDLCKYAVLRGILRILKKKGKLSDDKKQEETGDESLKNKRELITPAEAKQSLHALEVMSGRESVPANRGKTGKREQHEAKIQEGIFEWAAFSAGRYPELKLLFAIPNGGKRNATEGYYLKLSGVKSGVPDMCLPVARGQYHALYIELKAESGRVQESQRAWIAELNNQGAKAIVCYGFDEAKRAIEEYLKLKKPSRWGKTGDHDK